MKKVMKKVAAVVVVLALFAPVAMGAEPATAAADAQKAVQTARAALDRAEAAALRAKPEDITAWLKAATPVMKPGTDEKRRGDRVTNLVAARTGVAKNNAAGAARALAAAADLSRTPAELAPCWHVGIGFASALAKAGKETEFNSVAAVLRAKVCPKMEAPTPFLQLADRTLTLKKGFAAAEGDIAAALARAKDAKSCADAAVRAERLAGLLDKGDGKEAVALFARLERKVPKGAASFGFHQVRFRVMAGRKQNQLAEKAAEAMLAVAADDAQKTAAASAFQNLTGAFQRAGDAKAADRIFARAEAVAASVPFSAGMAVRRAALLRQFGKDAEAERVYREGLVKVEGDRALSVAFAGFLRAKGRADDAAAVYQAALKKAPADRGLLFALADVLAAKRDFDGAVNLLRSAKLTGKELLDGATRIERAGSTAGAEKLLTAIKPEELKDKAFAAAVQELKKRITQKKLSAAQAELERNRRLAATFAQRAGEAKAKKNDAGFKEESSRAQTYSRAAAELDRQVKALEAQLKALGAGK